MEERFGEFYRNTRESLGLTQSELAERLDCSISTISRMENGRAIRGTLAEKLPKVLPVPDHTFAWSEEDVLRREICQGIERGIASKNLEEIDTGLCRLLELKDDSRVIDRQYFQMYKAFWLYLMTGDARSLEEQTREALSLTVDLDRALVEMKKIEEDYDCGARVRVLGMHRCIERLVDRAFTRPEILLLNAYAVSRAGEREGFYTKLILMELKLKMERSMNGQWEGIFPLVLYNLVYAHFGSRTFFEARRQCKKLLGQKGITDHSEIFLRAKMLEYQIHFSMNMDVFEKGQVPERIQSAAAVDGPVGSSIHHGITFTNAVYIPKEGLKAVEKNPKKSAVPVSLAHYKLGKHKDEVKCLYENILPEERRRGGFEEGLKALDYILLG